MRRRIGIPSSQDLRLLDELSARDNVALPLRVAGIPEPETRDNVSELLAWARAWWSSISAPAQFSRRRAAAGRHRPRDRAAGRDLLLADEPNGNGDDEITTLLVRRSERLNRLGTTVLIATP